MFSIGEIFEPIVGRYGLGLASPIIWLVMLQGLVYFLEYSSFSCGAKAIASKAYFSTQGCWFKGLGVYCWFFLNDQGNLWSSIS